MTRRLPGLLALFCLILGGLAVTGGAAAQSMNSLSPAPAQPDLSTYNRLEPATIRSIIEQQGLTVMQDQAMMQGQGHVLVGQAQGVVFIFAFAECAPQGCLLMQQVHPIPTSMAGLTITPRETNAINAEFPFGTVFAQDGDMAFRHAVIAAPECATQCLLAQMRAYVGATNEIYAILNRMQGQATVSLDRDAIVQGTPVTAPTLRPGADLFAGVQTGALDMGFAKIGNVDLAAVLRMAGLDAMAAAIAPVEQGDAVQPWQPLID